MASFRNHQLKSRHSYIFTRNLLFSVEMKISPLKNFRLYNFHSKKKCTKIAIFLFFAENMNKTNHEIKIMKFIQLIQKKIFICRCSIVLIIKYICGALTQIDHKNIKLKIADRIWVPWIIIIIIIIKEIYTLALVHCPCIKKKQDRACLHWNIKV